MDARSQRLLLVSSAVIGMLAFWRLLVSVPSKVLMATYDSWFFVPIDAYPQMIFGMAGALVFHRRGELRQAMGGPGSPALAVLPRLAGTALFVWGTTSTA